MVVAVGLNGKNSVKYIFFLREKREKDEAESLPLPVVKTTTEINRNPCFILRQLSYTVIY